MNTKTPQKNQDQKGSGTLSDPITSLSLASLGTLFVIGLVLIGTVIVLFQPASAQNMSITTFNLLTKETVEIYVANGTAAVGVYNTSSTNIALPAQDFYVVIRPTGISRFADPVTMMTDAMSFVQTNWAALLVIGLIIGFATRRL